MLAALVSGGITGRHEGKREKAKNMNKTSEVLQ
jgi:hypothetical protein